MMICICILLRNEDSLVPFIEDKANFIDFFNEILNSDALI